MVHLTPLLRHLRILMLAVATVLALHFTVGSVPALGEATAGCAHTRCIGGPFCMEYTNHSCCFEGGECDDTSCLIQPDGCP